VRKVPPTEEEEERGEAAEESRVWRRFPLHSRAVLGILTFLEKFTTF